jgi:hypothetical protein
MLAADFDVFVTTDKGFEYEHNLRSLPMGIVIVHVPKKQSRILPDRGPAAPGPISSVPARTGSAMWILRDTGDFALAIEGTNPAASETATR